MAGRDYDLVVIGSGPAGHSAAIQATKVGKRVAMIEREGVVGGASVNTGTIPSKTLREAVMHLSGYNQRGIYGQDYRVKKKIVMGDLLHRTDHVISREIAVAHHQLMRNSVEVISATGSFVDPHTLRLNDLATGGDRDITADHIVIAVGTVCSLDPNIPFDGERIFVSDDLLKLKTLPKRLAVIGAGVIGSEYATIFAALGVRVTIIDKRKRLLDFLDWEITDALTHHMRENRVTLRLGEEVSGVEPYQDDQGEHVRIKLASGKQVISEKTLYAIGRTGATGKLNLSAAEIEVDSRGRISVNKNHQTNQDHIYAVGDVIGFPSLAATSMEQGRLASCHAFDVPAHSVPELFPFGIYTIPEISVVGKNEQQLTSDGVPYEVGKASYKEIARGQIIGDRTGLLKLIFHTETRKLLGVSIIGEGATELIHIGQAVLSYNGDIDYFVDTVFNYPTLAECYKTAALDGINRLS
jgi:NAD(P) transhydrogenase